jgi:hypothetical protein
MAISIGDAVLKLGVDSKEFDSNMKGIKDKLVQHSRAIGAAMTGIGVAGLAIVDSSKKMNAQLGVTGLALGITTGEMRALSLEVTNVTFPLDEVTQTFDLLARAGVRDTEVLKETAIAFDTLGDATGRTASEVTEKMVPAMKTFGLTAEEVASKSDAMTYLIRNSTVSMDNFGSVVGYITPELVEMGLTMDDTIALMGIMEGKGMSGEVATRAFRTAITQATREQIPLNEALGITSEEMDAYKEKLEGATGMTKEFADAANKQYGIMDRVKQAWSEMTLKASGFLEPLEPILAGMTALGPLMIFLSTQLGINTIAWVKNTIAMIAHKIAVFASTIATGALTLSVGYLTLALSGLFLGLGMVAFGVWQLVSVSRANAEITEKNRILQEEYNKALRGEANIYPELLEARMMEIQMRIQAGQATQEEIEWMRDYGEQARQWIDYTREGTAAINEQGDAWTASGEKAITAIQATHDISVGTISSITDAAMKSAQAVSQVYNKLTGELKMTVSGGEGGGWSKTAWTSEQQAIISKYGGKYVAYEKESRETGYPSLTEGERKIMGYQYGGLITRPTLAMLGEAGPELVTPLRGNSPINVVNNIYLDGELITQNVLERITQEVRLQGGL